MKKILFLSIFLLFNLGFSNSQSNTTGGYINNKWYAWYDNTFLGKETIVSEKFHKFKSLEVDLVGVGLYYDVNYHDSESELYNSSNKFENGFNKVFLKVSNFMLTDMNGNVYTKDNYPNEKRVEFIPNIIAKNDYLTGENIKFNGSEKIDKKLYLITLDVIPIKLTFVSEEDSIICAEEDGKTLHLSCRDIERNWYNIDPMFPVE